MQTLQRKLVPTSIHRCVANSESLRCQSCGRCSREDRFYNQHLTQIAFQRIRINANLLILQIYSRGARTAPANDKSVTAAYKLLRNERNHLCFPRGSLARNSINPMISNPKSLQRAINETTALASTVAFAIYSTDHPPKVLCTEGCRPTSRLNSFIDSTSSLYIIICVSLISLANNSTFHRSQDRRQD